MSRTAFVRPVVLSMALAITAGGCVSKSDLQALDHRLSDQLQGLSTSVAGLRTDTQAVQRAVQGEEAARTRVMEQIKTATAVTERTLDAMTAADMESRRSMQALRQEVAGLHERLQALPPLMVRLVRDLGTLHDALLGLYRVEETALRERLKALESVRREIDLRSNPADPAAPAPTIQPGERKPTSLYDVEDATARERLKAIEEVKAQLQQADSRPLPVTPPAP